MKAQNTRPKNDLLLYSFISFRGLIEPALALARPSSICEIGVEKGLFTEFLMEYCALNGCSYNGIDPSLNEQFISRHGGAGIVFFKERSLSALAKLRIHDAYFIDGDHNYFTVKNELVSILRQQNHWPLIFLHDVCWPWGRRDQYCSPQLIPDEYRHPCSAELGVVLGKSDLQENGFCGKESDYEYAAALHEGGPRNGVLTAVEDVMAEHGQEHWRLLIVPAVFGLGILYSPAHSSPELSRYIERISDGVALFKGLLDSLESNRIHLFLTYLKNVKELSTIHQKFNDLDCIWRQLHQSYDEIHQHAASLQSAYDQLLHYTKWLEAEMAAKTE